MCEHFKPTCIQLKWFRADDILEMNFLFYYRNNCFSHENSSSITWIENHHLCNSHHRLQYEIYFLFVLLKLYVIGILECANITFITNHTIFQLMHSYCCSNDTIRYFNGSILKGFEIEWDFDMFDNKYT